MKKIKLYFVDFWPGFDGKFFVWIFTRAGYQCTVTSENPDLLIYSVFGNRHLRYSCKKLFYTGENVRPPANEFSLSFDYSDNPLHYRFPLYTYSRWSCTPLDRSWGGDSTIHLDTIFDKKEETKEELLRRKTGFCVFMQGNGGCSHRNEFFRALNARKPVTSAGSLFNNYDRVIGWEEKLKFARDFKFMIAFENSSYPGYVTEKIFEPMLVKTIPIYWGSDTAKHEFNPVSYIDVNGLSIEEAVERVLEIDSNDDLYYEMYRQPYLVDNKITPYLDFEKLIEFIENKVLK
jgi:hypothetical protein